MLLLETVALLRPSEGRVIIDGTLGGGGHTEALLERGATVVGIDRDPRALAAAQARLARFGDRFRAVKGEFGDVRALHPEPVDGFVLDLGVSSPQLDVAERGFSFMSDGPLDMRMGDQGETAADLIERLEEDELANVLYELGEERASRAIARELKRRLPTTTFAAVEAVKGALPRKDWPKETHVATKTFQALRIAVNDELGNLDRALAAIPSLLKTGGVAGIISFHSLEDRRVKHCFRELGGEIDDLPRDLPVQPVKANADFEVLTRKAVVASDAEAEANPRARSARLRGLLRVKESR